ncbi:MAG: hypothetical protein WDM96_00985 [Lacunisphaera sp.]
MTAPATLAAWALVLPARLAGSLSPLRLVPGLEIAVVADSLWLRGRGGDAGVELRLMTLPAQERYAWLEDDALRPVGSRLVTARLPAAEWRQLRHWLQVTLPVAALPATTTAQVALSLAAAEVVQPVNALETTIDLWAGWAAAAPAVRLKPLRFVASAAGRVLVLGAPPPSIPGRAMVESDGIVVPAGYGWQPAVSAATVRRAFGAAADTLVFWEPGGAQLLRHELFVPATRAGARATREAAR